MPHARRPWHPCDDGIEPITAALQRFVALPLTGLRGRLECRATQPIAKLADELNEPGLGWGSESAGRREMLRRWLQFHGFGPDATECDARLQAVLDSLRAWQQRTARGRSVRGTESGLCEAEYLDFEKVRDEAAETADYLKQLGAMLRARLANAVGGGPAAPAADVADPIPLTWLRGIIPKRRVKGTAWHLGKWIQRRGHRLVKIAGKLHCERADARVLFKGQADLIDEYERRP